MATLVDIPKFWFGLIGEDAGFLPDGWTLEEAEGQFLKVISPGGVRFFWDGYDVIHEELPPLWPGGSVRADEPMSLMHIHENTLLEKDRVAKKDSK